MFTIHLTRGSWLIRFCKAGRPYEPDCPYDEGIFCGGDTLTFGPGDRVLLVEEVPESGEAPAHTD